MKKRIALINPPSPFLRDEKVLPNLGLLYVATEMLRQNLDVTVFDFCGDKEAKEHMRQIAEEDFDIYGFSTTTPQFFQTYNLFRILKENNPRAFTVIGGPHPTSVGALRKSLDNLIDPNISRLEEFDLIFEGDCEHVHQEIFKKGPKWRTMPLDKSLDNLDIPDRSLYDIKSYHYKMEERDSTSLITQRGCPFKCIFCCGREIPAYKISRFVSPKRVLEEMDYLNGEFGFDAFVWGDDEVNINRKRIKELAKLLRKRDYVHKSAARPDLLVKFPETAEMLAEAGFVEIACGIESGSQRILNNIQKRTHVEENFRSVELLRRNGIKYKAFTMLGHPGETYEDVMLTKKWLLEAQPDFFDTSLLQPYPGSIIYDHSIPSDVFKDYKYSYGLSIDSPPQERIFLNRRDFSQEESFFKGISGRFVASIRSWELSAEDYLSLRDELEKDVREKLYGDENKSRYYKDTRSRLAASEIYGTEHNYS